MRMALAEGARCRREADARLPLALVCEVVLCAVVDLCVVEPFVVEAAGDFLFVVALEDVLFCDVDALEESDDCAATCAMGINAANSPATMQA